MPLHAIKIYVHSLTQIIADTPSLLHLLRPNRYMYGDLQAFLEKQRCGLLALSKRTGRHATVKPSF